MLEKVTKSLLLINDNQYSNMIELIQNNPKLLMSPELIKFNRSVSYMTFLLKEAFDYVTQKVGENILLYKLRRINYLNNIDFINEV
jgi:hypothetical protein